MKFVHMMLPTAAAASASVAWVLIGPGAVVDMDRLKYELSQPLAASNCSVVIHPSAVILAKHHQDEEKKSLFVVGSTMKGTSAAYIEKMRRDPTSPCLAKHLSVYEPTGLHCSVDAHAVYISEEMYSLALDANADRMLIEGAQGCSLSIHSRFWPYCTSRDVSIAQLMADCAIPFSIARHVEVIGTARTFPIRVANRYDENGRMIGTSGGCYADQKEIGWTDMPCPPAEPERTTVTQLQRRVFTFSEEQVSDAVYHNNVTRVYLNFANYLQPRGDYEMPLMSMMAHFQSIGAHVDWIGWGPTVNDIEEVSRDEDIRDG